VNEGFNEMSQQRDRVKELSFLWNGVMRKCREIYEHIPAREIKELSDTEIEIISLLSQSHEIVVGDISKALLLPKSTVTGLIARLEKKNMIRRTIKTDDLRTFGLALTDKGKKTHSDHLKFEAAFYSRLIEPLSEKESTAFFELLRSIVSQGGREDGKQ
jgi:DNA-binding MarR family transcriptional regulator